MKPNLLKVLQALAWTSFWLAIMLWAAGLEITFIPRTDNGSWFGWVAVLAVPGLFIPGKYLRGIALVVMISSISEARHHRKIGIDSRKRFEMKRMAVEPAH